MTQNLSIHSANKVVYFSLFFFFGHATQLVGSSLPDQGPHITHKSYKIQVDGKAVCSAGSRSLLWFKT